MEDNITNKPTEGSKELTDSPAICQCDEAEAHLRRVRAAAKQIPNTTCDTPADNFTTCHWYRVTTPEQREALLAFINVDIEPRRQYDAEEAGMNELPSTVCVVTDDNDGMVMDVFSYEMYQRETLAVFDHLQETFALPPLRPEAIDPLQSIDPRILYKMKLYLCKGTVGWQVTEGLMGWLDDVLASAEKAGRFRFPEYDEETDLFDDDYYNIKHNPFVYDPPPLEKQADVLLPQYLYTAWLNTTITYFSEDTRQDSYFANLVAALQNIIKSDFGVTDEMLQAAREQKEKGSKQKQ